MNTHEAVTILGSILFAIALFIPVLSLYKDKGDKKDKQTIIYVNSDNIWLSEEIKTLLRKKKNGWTNLVCTFKEGSRTYYLDGKLIKKNSNKNKNAKRK